MFTTCGQTGRTGPSAAQMKFAYAQSGSAMASLGNSGGIQLWTVPKTGNYRFDIAGAKGGDAVGTGAWGGGTGTLPGGKGRVVYVTCLLTQGQQVKILVGQAGGTMNRNGAVGAGGGASAVAVGNAIVGVGGGGGGARYGPPWGNANGVDAPAATYGINYTGNPGQNNGAGGMWAPNTGYEGGGGGGWSSDGKNATQCGAQTGKMGGSSWANGMAGGLACIYPDGRGAADGGFGGGGGAWIAGEARPGGGGGYSGGDGQTYTGTGGGGGGSSLGSLSTISTAVYGDTNNGDGYVTVWNADAQPGWAQPLYGIWRGPSSWQVMLVFAGGKIVGGNWGSNIPVVGNADGTYAFPSIGGGPFKKAADGTATWNGSYLFKKNPDARGNWVSADLGVNVQFDYDAAGVWHVVGGTWGDGRKLAYNDDGSSFSLPDIGGGAFTLKSATTAAWAGSTFTKQ